jgi:catechol 2,3-dioxygenase-like lactoylglutathione lyase family enzyme
MDIAIYVATENDQAEVDALFKSFGPKAQGNQLRAVNLLGSERDGIPAEVIQVMMLKKTGAFPLTVVDSMPVVSGKLPTQEELEKFVREGVKEAAILVNGGINSAVDFPFKSRLHISLDVNSIEKSLPFYKVLFNAEPTKLKKDYAKFELEDPPLNFTLNGFGRDVSPKDAPVNHFGIQAKNSDRVVEAKERYTKAGFHVEEETQTACCYAVQTKIWVADPDGNKWEVYVVTEAENEAGCGDDCICWDEITPSQVAGAPDLLKLNMPGKN